MKCRICEQECIQEGITSYCSHRHYVITEDNTFTTVVIDGELFPIPDDRNKEFLPTIDKIENAIEQAKEKWHAIPKISHGCPRTIYSPWEQQWLD